MLGSDPPVESLWVERSAAVMAIRHGRYPNKVPPALPAGGQQGDKSMS